MPRKNSTSWSVGNPITATRQNNFNSDIDDLYALGSDRLKIYRLSTDPALQITIGAGNYRVWSAEGQYAGGTVTVANNVTTYFMINSSGTIVTNTTGFVGTNAKLGTVVSSGGVITTINIFKIDALGGDIGGAWFGNITSTTYSSNGRLTGLIADGVTYTITYSGRRVKAVTNGTNTWTPTWSANGKLSTQAKT